MTVAAQTPISSYTGNGVTTAFSFGYYVAASGDLVVMVDGVVKALTTDYTLTGIGSGSGGTCTFLTAPASGAAVVLYRDTDLLRDTDYQDNGDLLAAILNGDFDRIWLALQETITGAKLSPRAVRAPVGETLNELPEATTRAGKILSFNASTGQPEAVAPTSGTATDLAIQLASTATGQGASLVGVEDSQARYAATTVEGVLYEIAQLGPEANVLSWVPSAEWAAILGGTSTYDATSAVNSAMSAARVVRIPGRIRITSQLNIPTTCSAIVGADPYTCYIDKQFNGDAIKADPSGFRLVNVGIEGNGATFTGGGVRPRGYNILIAHCRINGTADSPVIVEPAIGSNALAATYLRVDSCFLNPLTPSTTYAIRSTGIDDSTRPTCRVFSNLSGGSSLVDFSGMNYAVLTDSLGTALKFDANCSKVMMRGNRLTTAGIDITILGEDHIIDGNMFGIGAGRNVIIDASCVNVDFGPTNKIAINGSNFATVVDNRASTLGNPNPNTVYDTLSTFAFTWTASVTNPTLGNSTSYGYYNRSGRRCLATFGLIRGSTANVGSGDYSFQLPFEAWVTATGVARIKSSTGTYYTASVVVQGGSSLATMYIDTQTAQFGSASITFGTGGQIDASIDFLISPT